MPLFAAFGWLIVWLLAGRFEKLQRSNKQRILDENPYWTGYKSEQYLEKHGLTPELSKFQCAMRDVNRIVKCTPEKTAMSLVCRPVRFDSNTKRDLTYHEMLEKVEENWYCLKEIDEKPQYKYTNLPSL